MNQSAQTSHDVTKSLNSVGVVGGKLGGAEEEWGEEGEEEGGEN